MINKFLKISAPVIVLFLISQTLFSQKVTLGITTSSDSVRYSPRHVFAAWVVDDSCRFVKSLEVSAVKRIKYLYTWNIVAKANVVDAVTGATITEPKSHNLVWDCKDLNGKTVPDGNYTIWVEFTGQHAQGPLYSVAFTKSAFPQKISHSDNKFFKNISLSYIPR